MATLPDFHAYAETYPLLEGEEYERFKADIRQHGIRNPVLFRVCGGKIQYLDGRNRLRAAGELKIECPQKRVEVSDAEVEAFIDSQNEHRRHLSLEQKRNRIAALLKKSPEKSDRSVAAKVGVSHTTVAKNRENLLSTGQIGQLETRVGKDEKERPTQDARHQAIREHFSNGKPDEPERQPGDDTDSETQARQANATAKKRSGKVVFDDRKVLDAFGKLTRLLDDRAAAYGKHDEHRACLGGIDVALKAFKRWQKVTA